MYGASPKGQILLQAWGNNNEMDKSSCSHRGYNIVERDNEIKIYSVMKSNKCYEEK